jgi:hypothetical protein
MIKGASEILAKKCKQIVDSTGQIVAFDDEATRKFEVSASIKFHFQLLKV